MTQYIDNARNWMDAHGVLAQIKREVHINNLEAELEVLKRENEQLRKQVAELNSESYVGCSRVVSKIRKMHGTSDSKQA